MRLFVAYILWSTIFTGIKGLDKSNPIFNDTNFKGAINSTLFHNTSRRNETCKISLHNGLLLFRFASTGRTI